MRIRVGDTVSIKPSLYISKDGQSFVDKHVRGKVTYVNRRHRYFTVEYQLTGGRIRESFKF